MIDYANWSISCKSRLAGQDYLFDEIILNFIGKRANFNGIHGIVLEGATGSGKTTICRVLQEKCPFEVIFKDCIEIFINSKIGGSEREIQNIFTFNSSNEPLLIIFDHAESVFGLNSKDTSVDSESLEIHTDPMPLERKLFLLAKFLMDKIDREAKRSVFLIAIITEKSVLPAEIKFPGRLNHFFNVNISRYQQREALLRTLLSSWPFASEEHRWECIKILSGQPTSGFTPADLESFLQRTWEIKSDQFVSLNDFLNARHLVSPSSIVARLTKIPPIKIDVIGLEKEMKTIQQYMSAIFRNDRSVPLPRGILLEGPSGCGKSLLASKLSEIPFKIGIDDGKTIKFPVNFISIDSTQIISKYFGQSDRNLSQIFNEARQAAPCILFFDQIDTLVGKRSSSGSGSEDRLVTTFLVEMDGLKSKLDLLEENRAVIVLGTTSKKALIDPAILRPGRLDLHVNIPLPDRKNRLQFIEKFTSTGKYNLSESEVENILNETDRFSYAELDAIFKEAAMTALRKDIDCLSVEFEHFNL